MLVHRSPSLTAIYNEIKRSHRNRLLDLGSMSEGCFRVFSELSCKIQVEDLSSSIREYIDGGGSPSDFKVEQVLSACQQDEKFDVILAWDVFNFLALAEIEKLFSLLSPYCKPNTLIYMLRYVGNKIPLKPREFFVKDKYLIELSETLTIDRETKSYSTLEYLKAMPGCFMQDTEMDQMGMLPGITEHVLRYSPSSDDRLLIGKSESTRKPVVEQESKHIHHKQHYSPALSEILSLLQSASDISVLDLGAAANRTKDRIVDNSGSYYRVDLYSLIERSRSRGLERLNLEALKQPFSKKFDVIIAWDLFAFCSHRQITQINDELAQLSHSNTFLLCFMYTGRTPYALPSKFEVLSGNCLNIATVAEQKAERDIVTGVALLKLLRSYSMDKTYAYREGMDRQIIEYIFEFKGEHAASSAMQNRQ